MKNLFRIDASNATKEFQQLAIEIATHYDLTADHTKFKIVEMEFYLFDPIHHRDGFAHFHNRTAGEFRSHNSGLDITITSKNPDSYGGILIRSIQNLSTGQFINGPRKCVFAIFDQIGSVAARDITFGLEPTKTKRILLPLEPVIGPRIGLGQPNRLTPKDDHYKSSSLRFIFSITPLNKVADKEKLVRHLKVPELDTKFCGYKIDYDT